MGVLDLAVVVLDGLAAAAGEPTPDPVPVQAPEPVPTDPEQDTVSVLVGALQSAAGVVTALTVVGGALWVILRPHFRRMVSASKVQAEAVSDTGPIAVRLDELREHSTDNRRLLDQVVRSLQDTGARVDRLAERLDDHLDQHLTNDSTRDRALIQTMLDKLAGGDRAGTT